MRFAGTWRRYSKSAMPQLASAASHHGFDERLRKWAYQANVMKTFEAVNSSAEVTSVGAWIKRCAPPVDPRTQRAARALRRGRVCGCPARARAAAAGRTRARACA